MSTQYKWFEITPSDTLFFRDGRPFNQDETITLAGVESLFPPSPATVAGAILATYAKKLNWEGYGAWEQSIKDKLENSEKPLDFSGIFLKKGDQVLFPVPQHLVELRLAEKPKDNTNVEVQKDKPDKRPCDDRKYQELNALAFLEPSEYSFKTDIGEVHLPEIKHKTNEKNKTVIKPLDGYWISQAGLARCLQLKLPEPETLYHQSELWAVEPKVGITRDNKKGTTIDGMLYSPSHIRLCKDVSIVVGVKNLPENTKNTFISKPFTIKNELLILGGEAKTAIINELSDAKIPNTRTKGNLIYIASPTPMRNPQKIKNLKTACMPRQQRFGGWDSTKGKYGEPRPLTPFLKPGTILFMDEEVDTHWANNLAPDEFTQTNIVYGQSFFGEYINDRK